MIYAGNLAVKRLQGFLVDSVVLDALVVDAHPIGQTTFKNDNDLDGFRGRSLYLCRINRPPNITGMLVTLSYQAFVPVAVPPRPFVGIVVTEVINDSAVSREPIYPLTGTTVSFHTSAQSISIYTFISLSVSYIVKGFAGHCTVY